MNSISFFVLWLLIYLLSPFHVFLRLPCTHQMSHTISKVLPCKKSDIACSRRHSSWRPCNLLIACRGFQRAAISCVSRILDSRASCVGKTQLLSPSADSAGFLKDRYRRATVAAAVAHTGKLRLLVIIKSMAKQVAAT